MHLQLACPNCATSMKADNINITSLVAKCHHCHHVFTFSDKLRPPTRERPEIILPAGFEAFTSLSSLDIEFSWKKTSKTLGFYIFFTLFWNGILSVFVITAFSTGAYETLLYTSLHLLVGILLIYYVLSMLLNKTNILVSQWEIQIEHGPLRLPTYPNRNIRAAELDQLFINKYVSSRTNDRPNYAFAVHARLKGGKELPLIKGLRQPEQAAYIEQQIEKFLRIEDRPMEGEFDPGN